KVIGLYDKEKERDFFGFSVEAEARNDGLEEGLKEGLREGLKEGKAKGLEEGKEKGKIEAKKETALALLKANIDIEVITKATGLTIKEINQLNNNLL
ncbi:MAG: transposase, partial [Bacilli bacterium]